MYGHRRRFLKNRFRKIESQLGSKQKNQGLPHVLLIGNAKHAAECSETVCREGYARYMAHGLIYMPNEAHQARQSEIGFGFHTGL